MTDYKKILLNRWEESNKQILLQKELERITNELNREPIKNKEPDSFTQVFSNQDIREIIMKNKLNMIRADKTLLRKRKDWKNTNNWVEIKLETVFYENPSVHPDFYFSMYLPNKEIEYLHLIPIKQLAVLRTNKELPNNLEDLLSIEQVSIKNENKFSFPIKKVKKLDIWYYWGDFWDIHRLMKVVNKFPGYKKINGFYEVKNYTTSCCGDFTYFNTKPYYSKILKEIENGGYYEEE